METEEITLSMQKGPEDGFVRVLAFDVKADGTSAKLTAMSKVTQKEYDDAVDVLEEVVSGIQKQKKDANCVGDER